jgi:hypothetical protein
MPRQQFPSLSAFVLGIGAIPVPGLHLSAWSRDQAPETHIEPRCRTAFAAPLLSAACLSIGVVRGFLVRDGAINGFVSTGNRMLDNRHRLTGSATITTSGSSGRHASHGLSGNAVQPRVSVKRAAL